jgi:hypothetical protein
MDDGISDHQKAYRRHAAFIEKFAKDQQEKREWICFSEIAERYAREIGRSEGYEQLRRSVIAGEFERDGRSRVRFFHPTGVSPKMTRERMRNISDTYPIFPGDGRPLTIERQYLAWCWIPRDMAIRWCITHNVSVAGWLNGTSVDHEDELAIGEAPSRNGPAQTHLLPAVRPQTRALAYAHAVLLGRWGQNGPPRSMSFGQITKDANDQRDPGDKKRNPGGISESTVRRLLLGDSGE